MIVRFAIFAIVLSVAGYIGLYVMAKHFEPEPREVTKSLPVKIDRLNR
ncbi:MAG: hypothetical protein AAFQ45_05830 [Pseudomonadota bacterium]